MIFSKWILHILIGIQIISIIPGSDHSLFLLLRLKDLYDVLLSMLNLHLEKRKEKIHNFDIKTLILLLHLSS